MYNIHCILYIFVSHHFVCIASLYIVNNVHHIFAYTNSTTKTIIKISIQLIELFFNKKMYTSEFDETSGYLVFGKDNAHFFLILDFRFFCLDFKI